MNTNDIYNTPEVIRWRAQNRRLFAKERRAAELGMRAHIKRRTQKKWTNAYFRAFYRIPLPPGKGEE